MFMYKCKYAEALRSQKWYYIPWSWEPTSFPLKKHQGLLTLCHLSSSQAELFPSVLDLNVGDHVCQILYQLGAISSVPFFSY